MLLVDPQNDFCPGGSLPVADGERVMPVLSEWAAAADRAQIPIVVTRDWHPPKTTHFKENGGIWPAHCVMGTPGAEFHPSLRVPRRALIVSKGMGADEDAYSAFQARDDSGTLLADLLANQAVGHVYIGGLATDYCVKSSTLDALANGLRVTLIPDAMRAVNLQPTDGDRALADMRAAGADEYGT